MYQAEEPTIMQMVKTGNGVTGYAHHWETNGSSSDPLYLRPFQNWIFS